MVSSSDPAADKENKTTTALVPDDDFGTILLTSSTTGATISASRSTEYVDSTIYEDNVSLDNDEKRKTSRENCRLDDNDDTNHDNHDDGDGAEDDQTVPICVDVQCPQCGSQAVNRMHPLVIPGFRQCLIMSFLCSFCGSRSSEVKVLGAYGVKGRRWTLRVEDIADLSRDVLKSHTASIKIPEVEVELCTGTLGGVFTTVEGLIVKVADQLEGTTSIVTDEVTEKNKESPLDEFLKRLRALVENPAEHPFHIILDDPVDLSGISHRERRAVKLPQSDHLNSGDNKQAGYSNVTKLGDSGSELLAQTYESSASANDELTSAYDHVSFVPDISHNHFVDPQLKVESYERSKEQDEELGLSDMQTDGYTTTFF